MRVPSRQQPIYHRGGCTWHLTWVQESALEARTRTNTVEYLNIFVNVDTIRYIQPEPGN